MLKADRLVLAIVIALSAVVLWTIIDPAPGGGTQHTEFSTMRHGGSGAESHEGTLFRGWLFGALIFLSFGALIAFGISRGGSGGLRGSGGLLVGAVLAAVLVWTWLIFSYQSYLEGETQTLWLALPVPTAIVIYILYPTTALLNVLFVIFFKRWVLSEEDLESYNQVLEKAGASDSTIGGGS